MTKEDWLQHLEGLHPKGQAGIELGLERIRLVKAALGQTQHCPVITVGGTNGKGSTCAYLENIIDRAGYKVGCYTSPHLLAYNERIRLNGQSVSDEALCAAFARVEAARRQAGDVALTYFEFGTLAALWFFERAGLELAVLEVGLGGRLDAVNLIDPDVAVITTVDIDHTDWLGADREAIGAEKAGIARAWKPLVLGEVDSPSSVLRHAYAIGANALRLGSDFFHEPIDGSHWRWREVGAELVLPMPVLSAPAQRANAASAIAALRALPGDAIPDEAFAQGVAQATLPGRLQRVPHGEVDVVLDVGHNPQAARELAAWLQAHPAAGETHVVFAALADKDVTSVVDAFAGTPLHWHLAGLDAGPRSQSADQLAARLEGTVAARALRHPRVEDALAAALAGARAGDRVLVFGSFHTVAEALRALHSGR